MPQTPQLTVGLQGRRSRAALQPRFQMLHDPRDQWRDDDAAHDLHDASDGGGSAHVSTPDRANTNNNASSPTKYRR
jgi:hypothetical protein